MKPILFSYWRSSCSFRVRIGLALKEIDYEYRAVTGDTIDSEEYFKLNPSKKVPTLCIDDDVFTQSGAILEYLDETKPEIPLLPSDPKLRAKVRAFCMIIGADIQPLQNIAVVEDIADLVEESKRKETKEKWVNYWMLRGFTALEASLKKYSGKYSFGDEITLADVFLYPQVVNAQIYQVNLSAYPNIKRVSEGLADHPAFIAAHPNNMPDCPQP
ncbi:maleylacetoacetate isomerase [Thraustotheca clavata]|uniref:Maleylacetoacetate isomerase n=1 Tax=Thraustotheca clavata TaxID=74557 RepID=A0A1W0A370_9STRA|nr:maleylacetoacetate isomerase [Thraustotheca clavata]